MRALFTGMEILLGPNCHTPNRSMEMKRGRRKISFRARTLRRAGLGKSPNMEGLGWPSQGPFQGWGR